MFDSPCSQKELLGEVRQNGSVVNWHFVSMGPVAVHVESTTQSATPAGLGRTLWLPTSPPPQAAALACQPNSIYMVIRHVSMGRDGSVCV